jgi:hypothetical protein
LTRTMYVDAHLGMGIISQGFGYGNGYGYGYGDGDGNAWSRCWLPRLHAVNWVPSFLTLPHTYLLAGAGTSRKPTTSTATATYIQYTHAVHSRTGRIHRYRPLHWPDERFARARGDLCRICRSPPPLRPFSLPSGPVRCQGTESATETSMRGQCVWLDTVRCRPVQTDQNRMDDGYRWDFWFTVL